MNGAENVMSDDAVWSKIDELQQKHGSLDRELAVSIRRIDSLEQRTESIMLESAAARAETRQLFDAISESMSQIRSWQDRHDGRKEGEGWAEDAKRYAIPAIISAIALGRTMGWW